MHVTVKNLKEIIDEINKKINDLNYINYNPNIIAVTKTFNIEIIEPLIEHGHIHFGENKIQEAIIKWSETKKKNKFIKLHMIGKLQTNKVKDALKIFDFIHSVDSEKLANKISNEQKKIIAKPKIFIQINIGEESQKSGINPNSIIEFYKYCKSLDLDVIGTMCIPPINQEPSTYFKKMFDINNNLKIQELSMGMSSDYLLALANKSTYLRIGSKIFGQRN